MKQCGIQRTVVLPTNISVLNYCMLVFVSLYLDVNMASVNTVIATVYIITLQMKETARE
jgi:hypothetical protein